jgi:hypothetical protein
MNQDTQKKQLKIILQYHSVLVQSRQRMRTYFMQKHKVDLDVLIRLQYVIQPTAYHTFLSATAMYKVMTELGTYLNEWKVMKNSIMKHNQCVRTLINHNITRDRYYSHILMMDEVKTEEPGFFTLAKDIRMNIAALREQLIKAKNSTPLRKLRKPASVSLINARRPEKSLTTKKKVKVAKKKTATRKRKK